MIAFFPADFEAAPIFSWLFTQTMFQNLPPLLVFFFAYVNPFRKNSQSVP